MEISLVVPMSAHYGMRMEMPNNQMMCSKFNETGNNMSAKKYDYVESTSNTYQVNHHVTNKQTYTHICMCVHPSLFY